MSHRLVTAVIINIDRAHVEDGGHGRATVRRSRRGRRLLLPRTHFSGSRCQRRCDTCALSTSLCNFTPVDRVGCLPITYACKEGHYDVVKFLLNRGSDFSSYLCGHSAVEKAAASNSCEILELLLERGAAVDDTGVGGRPPLVSAASGGCLDALGFLLDAGADPNQADLLGNTALHVAVTALPDPAAVVRLLLIRGADKSRRNLAGETAVTLALRSMNAIAIKAIEGA